MTKYIFIFLLLVMLCSAAYTAHPGQLITLSAEVSVDGQVVGRAKSYLVVRSPLTRDTPVYVSTRKRVYKNKDTGEICTWVDHTCDGWYVRIPLQIGTSVEFFNGWQVEDGRVLLGDGNLVTPYTGVLQ